jgi:uncharacterized protein (DUF3820 family)
MNNNIQTNDLPIVTFGKYKGQSVTEMLVDTKYIEWCKLQDWFPKTNVYNICVNQVITTNNNSKTPEHNKLQNKFLDKNIQYKFINKIYEKKILKIKSVLNNINQNEHFNKINLDDIKCTVKDDSIEFEGIYNWDVIINHQTHDKLILLSNLEFQFLLIYN